MKINIFFEILLVALSSASLASCTVSDLTSESENITTSAQISEDEFSKQEGWYQLVDWTRGLPDGTFPKKAITCGYIRGVENITIKLSDGYQIGLYRFSSDEIQEECIAIKGYEELILDKTQKYKISLVHGKLSSIDSAEDISIEERINVQLFKDLVSEKVKSKNKIFGIEIDNSKSKNSVTRIYDAAGLHNDYLIGDDYYLHEGNNNFDYIYPWCDIRLCNINNINGNKTIIYSNEPYFKNDGSNGDVMVEIPKFFSSRIVEGRKEKICITGEAKPGFDLEPAFYDCETGEELNHIYVGAYLSSVENDRHTSKPGITPTIGRSLIQFREYGEMYDFVTLQCIQKLISIEMCSINLSKIFGGLSFLPYINDIFAYETINGNSAVFDCSEWPDANLFENGFKIDYLFVGEGITISDSPGIIQDRTITELGPITEYYQNGVLHHRRVVSFDGNPVTILANKTMLYGHVQQNGLTMELEYHTGRKGLTPYTITDQFKYRYIEGLWGNVGEMMDGVRLKDLNYYVSYKKSDYKDISKYTNLSYKSVEHTGYIWNFAVIKEMGYDPAYPSINLPSAITNDDWSYESDWYGDILCAYNTIDNSGNSIPPGTEFIGISSMAWDGALNNGPYMYRFWITENETSWLYGTRMVYRSFGSQTV